MRVLPRRDRFDRFVSVLVFVPRDRYDSDVRKAIGDYLADAYNGHVSAFYPFFPEGPLVRVHFIIGRARRRRARSRSRRRWKRRSAASCAPGATGSREALAAAYAPARRRRCSSAIATPSRRAIARPIRRRSRSTTSGSSRGCRPDRPLGVDFHRRDRTQGDGIGLKVWSHDRPIPLSERVPVLENMGFQVVDEQTYQIAVGQPHEPDVWFHDMMLARADGGAVDLTDAKQRLEATFLVVMSGGAESDGYNALVLTAGLMWREVALVRAISRFLRQIRVPYSQDYMWATLVKHAGIAADIVRLFHARFDPRLGGRGRRARRRRGGDRGRDRDGAAGGREPRRGPHPAPLRQCGAGGRAHQFLSDRR